MPQPLVLLDTSGGHSFEEVRWNGAPAVLSSPSIAYPYVDCPGSGQTPLTLTPARYDPHFPASRYPSPGIRLCSEEFQLKELCLAHSGSSPM